MVVSSLAAAVVIGGAGLSQSINVSAASPAAIAMAAPLPVEVVRLLERDETDRYPSITLALVQDQDAPATPNAADPGDLDAISQAGQPSEEVTDGGEIVVSGEVGAPAGDPVERINAKAYEVVEAVDIALVEPISDAYSSVVPEPIRDGVDNFLSNLGEPVSFLHYLLQLKPGKALKTLGRFAINTTLGIGGIFDVAAREPFGLEYEPNGLANTLGYYGVGPGPYLYLPLMGSTTVRDLIGRIADLSLLPAVVGKPLNEPYYAIPAGVLNSLNYRVDMDDQIESLRDKCGDPYAANRDLYLIQREAEINALKGNYSLERGEMTDRLEFNCDIELSDTPSSMDDRADFIRESTTLVDKEKPATETDATPDAPVVEEPDAAPAPPATESVDPVAPATDDAVEGPDDATEPQPLAA